MTPSAIAVTAALNVSSAAAARSTPRPEHGRAHGVASKWRIKFVGVAETQ